MSGFARASKVEAEGNAILLPYLNELSDGRLVVTNKGVLAKWLQECVGDVLMMNGDEVQAVEIKTEREHTGNLFLETFSNRNLESRASHAERGQNPGWMFKIKSDLLLYYFLDRDWLYTLDVFELKRWFFGSGDKAGAFGSGAYREKRQGRFVQMNDTWGLCVPLRILRDELPKGAMRWTKVRQRTLAEAA